MRKWTSLGLLVLVILAAGILWARPRIKSIRSIAQAGAAYKAKTLCSGVLVAGLDRERLEAEELADFAAVKATIEEERVAASALVGLARAEARHHQGFGCVLSHGGRAPVKPHSEQVSPTLKPVERPAEVPWRISTSGSVQPPKERVDFDALAAAVDEAFEERHPEHPTRTRAVLVVKDGWIVAERYADGIGPSTRLPGWSMTKSVTNALVGILVGQGQLQLDKPLPVPEWSALDDPRRQITLDHLLRMTSGLAFTEIYEPDPRSDVVRMLFLEPDAGAYAASKPIEAGPDQVWQYSSGTTNIIARAIRSILGDEVYWGLPQRELFGPIGMESAVLEADHSGTFVGSSLMYATARDWARFGLLYLQDGLWEDERILPEGWVEYSVTPTSDSEGQYGAHFWLNAGGQSPGVPTDEFRAQGYDGQWVMIVPSQRTVIVRLGQTPNAEGFDRAAFEARILAALH